VLLRCSNLVKKFGGTVAVNNVSFEIQDGEILAIIGPNGAGNRYYSALSVVFTALMRGGFSFRERTSRGIPPIWSHAKVSPGHFN